MTIDNVRCNGRHMGAFLNGRHGAANLLDSHGKQRGLTSAYFVEGDRDGAYPVIDFIRAFVGSHGDVQPINEVAFDVVDHNGGIAQHFLMRHCVITAWSLTSPEQPGNSQAAGDDQAVRPDVEHVRIESADVEIHAGADVKKFVKTDPNQSN